VVSAAITMVQARSVAPVVPQVPRGRTAYALFLLLTAILIARPTELIPALDGAPLYEITIIATLLAALPMVLKQLSPAALIAKPITPCVFGICAMVLLSLLSQGKPEEAFTEAISFAKISLYYLMLISLASTPRRLRGLLILVCVCVTFIAILAILQYYNYINIQSLAPVLDSGLNQDGQEFRFERLRGPGIFNDPNDICHILGLSILACCYAISTKRSIIWRITGGAMIAVLSYAVILTQSRGGLLALLCGMGMLIVGRFGWKRALIPAALLLAGVLAFSSRQTNISTSSGTAQDRIQLWSDALVDFRQEPIFGIGVGDFQKTSGLVTHNSFLQSYAEMGFIGGTLFLGAFFMALRTVARWRSETLEFMNPQLWQLRPYLAAIIVAYIVGMMSLSRGYVVPTYLVLGLASAYQQCAARTGTLRGLRLTPSLVVHVIALSVLFLIAMYLFVIVSVRWQ